MADEDNKLGDQISGYNLVTHFQTFEPPPEMYDAIGFPPTTTKNQLHHTGSENASVLWKGFFTKPPEMNDPTSNTFYNQQKHDFSDGSNMVSHEDSSSSPWNHHHHHHHHHQSRLFVDDDDPSLRSIFSCHGNDQRPSQGLSLSLSSSSIALQPFELRQQQHDELRFGPSSSRSVNIQTHEHEYSHIRSSKYLGPAQELLNDFCSLRSNQNQIQQDQKMKQPQWQDHDSKSLYSLDLVELQRRKTKLFQILQQVDRRYKHYCDQMKAVTSSLESVAGDGAAAVYSSLASRAMSRHFRCLRDGIVREMKATKKAMGEKEIGVPGTVKGETPRLKLLDQTLRQQKALQQMSLMESHPWRPQRGLPERSVHVLRAWLFEHFLHPYPSDVDKHILARQTGLSRSQVSNWFINARVRLWKPMVEEMYMEELKEDDGGGGATDDVLQNPNLSGIEDQKPTHDQLARIDSECLSSIINHPDKNKNDVVVAKKNKFLSEHDHQNPSFGHSYGAMELDFSSYNHHSDNTGISYGGGGVSLTLGLHQHGGGGGGGGGGVSLAFTAASQNSLFCPRDDMEDCQTGVGVGYSLLENESQTLPYRNLMGAQLLHDLAG